MIVLLEKDAGPEAVQALAKRVEELGLEFSPLDEAKGRAFEVRGPRRGRVLALQGAPGVATILTRRTPLVGGEPLWPHFALRLLILSLLLMTVLVLLTAFLPPGLGDRSDPGTAADPTAPVEWYLRPLGNFLDLFPRSVRFLGGICVLLAWILFLLWPFLDRADDSTPRGRWTVGLMRAMGVALIVLFVLLAVRSEG